MRFALGIGLLVLALSLLLFFTARNGGGTNYRWYPEYNESRAQPYSTGVLQDLLRSNYPQLEEKKGKQRLHEWLPKQEEQAKEAAYVFIGQKPQFNSQEAEHLMDYLKQGGTAFLIAEQLPDSLFEMLLFYEDCGWNRIAENRRLRNRFNRFIDQTYAKDVLIGFTHPSLKERKRLFSYQYMSEQQEHSWAFFPAHFMCDKAQYQTAMLGYINLPREKFVKENSALMDDSDQGFADQDMMAYYAPDASFTEKDRILLPNFIRFKIGNGQLLLHTNPLLFTNFYLITREGHAYAQEVFSHLGKRNKIYWDFTARTMAKAQARQERPRPPQRSPMEYVFAQQPLRWAWYLLLATTVLYVLFRGKRRQRIVPVLAQNRNTALEFVRTIARLYFLQQNHASILHKQMQFFLSFIRQRYRLVTRDLNDELINRISIRANVPYETVKAIFDRYAELSKKLKDPNVTVSASTLNDFYQRIQRFHEAAEKANQAQNHFV